MDEQLVAAVRALSLFLVEDASLGETLQRVADVAVSAVEPATAVGVTLRDNQGRWTTAVNTSEISPKIDQAQYDADAGPCVTAYLDGVVVRVDDTTAVAAKWPAFSERARQYGVLSTLSLPLRTGRTVVGGFNLYATSRRAFTPEHETDAGLFAVHAAAVLANAQAYWRVFDLAAGLEVAMRSRATIEQAKGKIMAQYGCGPDEAWDRLVKISQNSHVRLRDVARQIVESPGDAD
jgi:GAF domain-containing protein